MGNKSGKAKKKDVKILTEVSLFDLVFCLLNRLNQVNFLFIIGRNSVST